MKIQAASDVGNIETFEDLKRTLAPFLDQTKGAINGGISVENLRAKLVNVTVSATDTDIQLNHALGVIPLGYVKFRGPNGSVYDQGRASWSVDNIYIRFSATGDYTVLVMG